MANKYVTVTNDSFKKITTTESYKLEYKLNPRKITLTETAAFLLRHISTPSVEGLLIVVNFKSEELNKLGLKSGSLKETLASYPGEWAFLRDGELIIQIDGEENIPLTPHELDSDVTRNGLTDASACEEYIYYEIDKTILEKICTAHSVMMQLSGSRASWTIDGHDFIFMAKTFWNGFYDGKKYSEEIQHSVDVENKREEIKRKGCMIEVGIFIIYLIMFFALDLENNDSAFANIVIFILLAAFIAVAVLRRKKAKEIQ